MAPSTPGNALIGHTGFVGGTLARDRRFDATFHSRTIETIRGQTFSCVVCAGVSAVKWLANKDPAKDWEGISRLIDCLADVKADRFVLISTIDVYQATAGKTERDEPPTSGLHPYGLHRLKLEAFVRQQFPRCTIVRLPALFGTGLRKNAVYDLIHLNAPEKVIANGSFQWYPTRRLADDIDKVLAADIDLINITAEPVEMAAIHDRFFAGVPIGAPVADPPCYDLRSIHDAVLGGHDGYHLSAGQIFDELATFIASARGAM
jgi:dTDP-4-dehydrorhamnose reductase